MKKLKRNKVKWLSEKQNQGPRKEKVTINNDVNSKK
jgi:hypothetical protein